VRSWEAAATRPVEQACFWLAGRRLEPAGPSLEGASEADVAIVGGGYTGLWTALHLLALEPRTSIVLLEAERVAGAASGRNAGMLSDTIDHSHALAVSHFGWPEARRLAALGRENQRELLQFLETRGIDCGLERSGQLHLALTDAHVQELRDAHECAARLGLEGQRLLSQAEAQAEIHSPRYRGALFNPGAVLVDPLRLAEGLAREVRGRGVRLHEHSAVLGVERAAGGVRVKTERGEVRARRAILATSAHSHLLLPGLRWRFIPLYDYVLVSEPLSAAQHDALGWRARQGALDQRAFFNYYRQTEDGRVLWGTSEAQYYPPNRVDTACDHSARHYQALARSWAWHFPELRELQFPFAWGGAICATTRFTPFFGSALGGRLLYGLGYTGHGLGTTHLAGRVLAHLALEQPDALLDLQLVRRKPRPYPPEPLRAWAVGAVSRALRRVDEGGRPSLLLRLLDRLGLGLSS
jgi:glycine/D-amino acid oxidase-like deaminating enzyme